MLDSLPLQLWIILDMQKSHERLMVGSRHCVDYTVFLIIKKQLNESMQRQ